MFGCCTWDMCLCLFMDLSLVTLNCEGLVLDPLCLGWLWRLDGNDQCVCSSNLMWCSADGHAKHCCLMCVEFNQKYFNSSQLLIINSLVIITIKRIYSMSLP